MQIPDTNDGFRIGPARYLREERERLAALKWRNFTAQSLGATVGAELHGLNLRAPLSDECIAEIEAALHAYKVVFFREQPLSAAQHTAFARRFGALEQHPFIRANDAVPELVRFEKSAEAVGVENQWHHDVTWRAAPSKAAVLRALQVPPAGGDTLFADMHAAYEGLAPEWQSFAAGLHARHDFMRAFGFGLSEKQREEMRAKYPPAVHPVVCAHAATGRPHLYVNRIFTAEICGASAEESARILSHLTRQAELPEHQCRFNWRAHSIAFWDNRAVQHYAASDYWPAARVMERASIAGETPCAAAL